MTWEHLPQQNDPPPGLFDGTTVAEVIAAAILIGMALGMAFASNYR